MKNFLCEKDRYLKNFADSVYTEFRRIRYGIKSCKKDATSLYLDEIRAEIVNYQTKGDLNINGCSPEEGWSVVSPCNCCGSYNCLTPYTQKSSGGCSCGCK